MKTLILLAVALFSFNGFAISIMCPEQGMGGDPSQEPIKTTTLKNGLKILVCGLRQGEKNEEVYSKFDIYALQEHSTSPLIYRVGANKKYKIVDTPMGINLDELVNFKGKNYPIYKIEIRCGEKNCKKTDDVCIFKRHPAFKSEIVSAFKKGESVKKAQVTELRELALTGHPMAYEVFDHERDFKMDAETSAEFKDSAEVLKRLRKDNCL